MIVKIFDPTQNSYNLLRSAGYGVFRSPSSGATSYTRCLGRNYYPHFHVYVNKEGSRELELNLHFDQKQVSHKGQAAHSGEYDGDLVRREVERIKSFASHTAPKVKEEPKKGFFARLFG